MLPTTLTARFNCQAITDTGLLTNSPQAHPSQMCSHGRLMVSIFNVKPIPLLVIGLPYKAPLNKLTL